MDSMLFVKMLFHWVITEMHIYHLWYFDCFQKQSA